MLFSRLWHGDQEPTSEESAPSAQTLVDSVGWILRSSSEPAIISTALAMIPDILRSPQHHWALFKSGAGWELIRRYYELVHFNYLSTDGEHETIRCKQAANLTHLLYFLLTPINSWQGRVAGMLDDANEMFASHASDVSKELASSMDPEARALALTFDDLLGRNPDSRDKDYNFYLNAALDTPMTRFATIGWLRAVRDSGEKNRSQNVAFLNRILGQYWNHHTTDDMQVNYAYVSAIRSCVVVGRRPLVLPSYHACLHLCGRHLASLWANNLDPAIIQVAGYVLILVSRVEKNVAYNLLTAMTPSWNDSSAERMGVLERISRPDRIPDFPVGVRAELVFHTLRICSQLLRNPELETSKLEANLGTALSSLSGDNVYRIERQHVLAVLLRCRLLLSQFMTILKSRDQSLRPIGRTITEFIRPLISELGAKGGNTLLISLIIAGFPDLMRPHFESELHTPEPARKARTSIFQFITGQH